MQPYQVLIIGCGNIAGGFDADHASSALPLTHAGAYVQNVHFDLAGCLDPNRLQRDSFASRWDVAECFSAPMDLNGRCGAFDVISICSPTAFHSEHLQLALELKPRLVFCEKPVTPHLEQTREWVIRFDRAGVALAINHTRRWAPDVCRLAGDLRDGKWGHIRSAVGHYSKGVLNNGGHMVDLLLLLLGPLELESVGGAVWDFWSDDPSIPAMLHTADGVPVSLSVANAADYAFFELQIVTERGVIAMEDGGAQWRYRRAVDSEQFKGYRALDAGEYRPGEYAFAMQAAVANIYGALAYGHPLASTGHTALQAQQICEQIRIGA